MKSKVIEAFQDKETGDVYKAGDSFTGSASRINELRELGYVKPVKESKQEVIENA